MIKKTVLLTGATGNMGLEGLKQLHAKKDLYNLVVLALPTARDRQILKPFLKEPAVKIIWGDLTYYADVEQAVKEADIVLHVGALVSPAADHQPKLAWEVNFGGTKNIVDAINKRPNRDQIKLLYVCTIAQTGNRAPPYHWGRVGDPMAPSAFDYYALSKIAAERYVIESGLKYWVSVRQTGIMHKDLLEVDDGIGYHQPLNNPLEWVTAKDSGRLITNACSDDLPEHFWRRVYNIGGGAKNRYLAHQFLAKMFGLMKVDFRKVAQPNWYATRNFHGQFYMDSDVLENYLHFRKETVDDVMVHIKRKLAFKMRILKYLPSSVVSEGARKQALKGDTPLRWIANNQDDKIKAFFGSREQWQQIPGWDEVDLREEDIPYQKLDHGYDENKPESTWNLSDINAAATFRGGECLSPSMNPGDLYTPLTWRCALGHTFQASPFLVLKAGHWCNECMKAPWNFDEQAKANPFLAQIWHADHDPAEMNEYQ